MHFYFFISLVHCGFAWHFMEVHWLFPVSWRSYLTRVCFKCIYWFMIEGSNEERLWCVEMRLTIYHYIEIQAWLHLLFITVYFTMALNSINGIFFPPRFSQRDRGRKSGSAAVRLEIFTVVFWRNYSTLPYITHYSHSYVRMRRHTHTHTLIS